MRRRKKMLTISTDYLEEVLIRTGTNLELKLKLDLNITLVKKAASTMRNR